jgi:hypothetical protein
MKHKYKDLLHYGVVYGSLLLTWVPLMTYFKNDVTYTAVGGLIVFVVADKIAHRVILNEK